MTQLIAKLVNFSLTGILLLFLVAGAQAATTTQTGTLLDGATYLIEVPSPWNGTLFLYSHGYVTPGSANPAQDVGDPGTRAFMLANGFALAGSSYAHTGWAIQEALPDQIAVLDVFDASFGKPRRTIAWGHSLGGIITAGLIQRAPERFYAALPMCGVLSGGVSPWNTGLHGAFAQAGNGADVSEVLVGAREVEEQVAHGLHAQPAELLQAVGRDTLQALDVLPQEVRGVTVAGVAGQGQSRTSLEDRGTRPGSPP